MKKILQSDGFQRLLAALLAAYLRFVYLTSKVVLKNDQPLRDYSGNDGQAVLACFHGRLVFFAPIKPKQFKLCALISAHRDGRLIANIVKNFKIEHETGSTGKGGAGAVLGLMRRVKAGYNLFITPDGPKGPHMTVSKGTVEVARLTGLPLYPLAGSCRNGWQFKSWDKFLLPKPFTTIHLAFGEPMRVPKEADSARRLELQNELQKRLTDLQAQADRACGRTPDKGVSA